MPKHNIAQHTLDRIKSVDIEAVAADLDMEVRNHKCKCPFHEDHHPSMKFWPATNTCKCFVCDKNFDPLRLVQEKQGLSFFDACLWIADHNGIYVEYEDDTTRQRTIRKPKRISKRLSFSAERLASSSINNNPSTINENMNTINDKLSTLNAGYLKTCFSTESPFCKALVSNNILTLEQMQHAAERYHLGLSADGGVIFWQIDEQQRLREGKIMYYTPDCHRSHDHNPITVSWILKSKGMLPATFSASMCLFGLHLVGEERREKSEGRREKSEGRSVKREEPIIAIVESEKTAVICSELIPELPSPSSLHPSPVTWLATGGKSNLTAGALQPLKGHKIIIFPDTDPDGSTYRSWAETAETASHSLSHPIYVSNILEKNATEDQKKRKIDIADFLIEQ